MAVGFGMKEAVARRCSVKKGEIFKNTYFYRTPLVAASGMKYFEFNSQYNASVLYSASKKMYITEKFFFKFC